MIVTAWRSAVASWHVGRSRARAALVAVVALLTAVDASAQLAAPNQTGVAMGHLHYTVKDVDANRQFCVALGCIAKKGTLRWTPIPPDRPPMVTR